MKKLILATFLFVLVLGVRAQTEAGKFLIGAGTQIGASFLTYKYQENGQSIGSYNVNTYSINPSIGYFLINNLEIGVTGIYSSQYQKEGSEVFSTSEYGIGPMCRYYFGHSKIKPYINGSIIFVTISYSNPEETEFGTIDNVTSTSKGNIFNVGPGVSIFVNNFLAIDGQIDYTGSTSKFVENSITQTTTVSGISVLVGFTISL